MSACLGVGGLPLLFLLALPGWLAWNVWRGLKLRSRQPWKVEVVGEQLRVQIGPTLCHEWLLVSVRRARYAQNPNWTESTFVEDALTLYDGGGNALKLPASAEGFRELLTVLRARAVPIREVDVSAPAFLD